MQKEAYFFRLNITECINEAFEQSKNVFIPFENIMTLCTGQDYNIVFRFYKQLNERVIEVIVEKIKNDMEEGYCDGIILECVQFFKYVREAMKKNLEILSLFENQKEIMERQIHPINLEYLTSLLNNQIGDYEVLKKEILQERQYLTSLFKEKLQEFNEFHKI